MALTVDEWYAKLKKFVPSWVFENEDQGLADGVFYGLAAIYHQVQVDAEDHFNATFIQEAAAPVLDGLGFERHKDRTTGETDAAYRIRVRNLRNASNLSDIQAAVDGQLHNGSATIIENISYGFFDDVMFCDDPTSRWMEGTKNPRFFTLIIPIQTGGNESQIRANLVTVLEDAKALGVSYDILYLSSADTDTGD